MDTFINWLNKNTGRVAIKRSNYLEIYERYLSKFANQSPILLEIGVCHGGSLQMWQDYFGDESRIYGIDINPNCKEAEENGVKVFIGDQMDTDFLGQVIENIGPPDIIIDDGGHTMEQQKRSFDYLFPLLSEGGVYICEDLHTSFWKKNFGGGLRNKRTFMEYIKKLADSMHAHYSKESSFKPDYYSDNIGGIHIHECIVAVEKVSRKTPSVIESGMVKIKQQSHISLLRHPRKWIRSKVQKIYGK